MCNYVLKGNCNNATFDYIYAVGDWIEKSQQGGFPTEIKAKVSECRYFAEKKY